MFRHRHQLVLLKGFLFFPKLVNPNTNYEYQKDIPGNLQWNWNPIRKLNFWEDSKAKGYSYLLSATFKSSCYKQNNRTRPLYWQQFPNSSSRLTLSAEEGDENIQRYLDSHLGIYHLNGNHISCLSWDCHSNTFSTKNLFQNVFLDLHLIVILLHQAFLRCLFLRSVWSMSPQVASFWFVSSQFSMLCLAENEKMKNKLIPADMSTLSICLSRTGHFLSQLWRAVPLLRSLGLHLVNLTSFQFTQPSNFTVVMQQKDCFS